MTGDFIICLLAFLNIYIFIFFYLLEEKAAVSLFWDTNMAAVTSLFSGEL